jgi:hypothetical protein
MTAPSADVALVVAAVKTELPTRWAQWGGGWPNEVEAALIDAVLSIRNRYGKKPTSGVRGSVGRYRTDRDTVPLDDLDVLAGYSLDRLTAVLDNRQKTGGVPKAQALINAAGVLSTAGIRHAAELNPNSLKHRAAYCSVKGLGPRHLDVLHDASRPTWGEGRHLDHALHDRRPRPPGHVLQG